MEYVGEETVVEDDTGDGGWVETHHYDNDGTTELEDKVCEMTLDNAKVRFRVKNLWRAYTIDNGIHSSTIALITTQVKTTPIMMTTKTMRPLTWKNSKKAAC